MATADLDVTIRAKDMFSPTLRRLSRRFWWYRFGPILSGFLFALGVVAGIILGAIVR